VRSVWIKREAGQAARHELFGGRLADGPRHPLPSGDPINTTEQLGVPGPWSERLPHFRSGFMPSSGQEIQSEFFVARADGPAAVRALLAIAPEIRPLLYTAEIRLIAATGSGSAPSTSTSRSGCTSPGTPR
jgi:xylitol oxidase